VKRGWRPFLFASSSLLALGTFAAAVVLCATTSSASENGSVASRTLLGIAIQDPKPVSDPPKPSDKPDAPPQPAPNPNPPVPSADPVKPAPVPETSSPKPNPAPNSGSEKPPLATPKPTDKRDSDPIASADRATPVVPGGAATGSGGDSKPGASKPSDSNLAGSKLPDSIPVGSKPGDSNSLGSKSADSKKLELPAAGAASGIDSTHRKAPLQLDATQGISAQSYTAFVERLALQFPDLLRVQSLGKSRAGHDLWLLTVSDYRSGDPDRKPALCVSTDLAALDPKRSADLSDASRIAVPGAARSADASNVKADLAGERGRAHGPEAALFLVARMLSDAQERPEIAGLLQRSTLYVLPCIDPDGTFPSVHGAGDDSVRPCCLDRNFPGDWEPWGDAPGSQGPYPLSEPESRSAALFFSQRTNASAVLFLARGELEFVDSDPLGIPRDELDGRELSREDTDERACEALCESTLRAAESMPAAVQDNSCA
jgi:Zinc carboxypeptidase